MVRELGDNVLSNLQRRNEEEICTSVSGELPMNLMEVFATAAVNMILTRGNVEERSVAAARALTTA